MRKGGEAGLWNVYPSNVDLIDTFRAKHTQHLVDALIFCSMIIRLLRPIVKYKEKGIKFLPYGTGQEEEIKTVINTFKCFLNSTAPAIKILPISWAGPGKRCTNRGWSYFSKIVLRRFSL